MLPFMLRAAGPKYNPTPSPVGPTPPPIMPLMWYDNGTLPASFGSWSNSGTGGAVYNLGTYAGTVAVTTFPSSTIRAAYFNGGANLQFTSGTTLALHQASVSSPFFVIGVASFDAGSTLGFVGSQGFATSLPNGIGMQSFPTGYEAYDNDGVPSSYGYTNPAGTPTQYGYYHNTSNQIFWYEARSSSAVYSNSGSYSVALTVRGITGMRGTGTANAYLGELLVYNTNLSTLEVQSIRDWLGAKYPTLGRVNA